MDSDTRTRDVSANRIYLEVLWKHVEASQSTEEQFWAVEDNEMAYSRLWNTSGKGSEETDNGWPAVVFKKGETLVLGEGCLDYWLSLRFRGRSDDDDGGGGGAHSYMGRLATAARAQRVLISHYFFLSPSCLLVFVCSLKIRVLAARQRIVINPS